MAEHWSPLSPPIALVRDEIVHLLGPVIGPQAVVNATLVTGGFSNTNYRIDLVGDAPSLSLRIYQRDPMAAEREAAIHRRLAGRLPLAELIAWRPAGCGLDYPFALFRWIEASPLEAVAGRLSKREWRDLGGALGSVLGELQGLRFARSGRFGEGLELAQEAGAPWSYLAFMEASLFQRGAASALGEALARRLWDLLRAEAALVIPTDRECSLVHGDFGARNILVQGIGKDLRLAAVIDWEFAHSGAALFDFGNLLRPPLGAIGSFRAALAAGFRAAGGVLPERWLETARLLDLINWVDLLTWPELPPGQGSTARERIAATLDSWPKGR